MSNILSVLLFNVFNLYKSYFLLINLFKNLKKNSWPMNVIWFFYSLKFFTVYFSVFKSLFCRWKTCYCINLICKLARCLWPAEIATQATLKVKVPLGKKKKQLFNSNSGGTAWSGRWLSQSSIKGHACTSDKLQRGERFKVDHFKWPQKGIKRNRKKQQNIANHTKNTKNCEFNSISRHKTHIQAHIYTYRESNFDGFSGCWRAWHSIKR